MVTVNDVTQMMFRWAPPELAMDWDNVGLLVGRGDREVHRVLVALDVSPDVAAEAAETGTDPDRVPPPGDEHPLARPADARRSGRIPGWVGC